MRILAVTCNHAPTSHEVGYGPMNNPGYGGPVPDFVAGADRQWVAEVVSKAPKH